MIRTFVKNKFAFLRTFHESDWFSLKNSLRKTFKNTTYELIDE